VKKFAANNGFTLIELMITLVVVIILVAIAAPSFNAMIRENRLATQANNFLGSLQLAKSEAIRRGVQVTMLRDGNAAGEWHGGWRIFTDWNRNETFDGNANATDCSVEGQDCYLRIYDSLGNNLILTGDAKYQDWIAFSPSGEVLSSGGGLPMGRFTLCTPNTNGREVVLNNAGRMRVEEGNAAC
jgi:type IV fimbrial biogenesis protein FimT